MAAPDLVNLSGLMDDAKSFAFVRQQPSWSLLRSWLRPWCKTMSGMAASFPPQPWQAT